ncbi:MAG: glyceraldehyde 3-phosphate dehydrogenase NAD-binding domain-containing protein [Thermodesulfobacteriota bacterium]
MIRIGINGFGRIGRTVARIIEERRQDMVLAAINDVAEDADNLTYLYNFDSTYGRARTQAGIVAEGKSKAITLGNNRVAVHCCRDIAAVPWQESGVDVVIDASGVGANVLAARRLVETGVAGKVIITHSPKAGIDRYIVMGLNHDDYDAATDHVVSSSICDVNAISHVIAELDRSFGIESGFVTTLHPWLSYQNLVDAPLPSQSNPGHFWKDYSLGRASIGALIPKDTTAVTALAPILPDVVGRLVGFSYRVPTNVVSSADLSLRLSREVGEDELCAALEGLCERSPCVRTNRQSLVSVDYVGEDASAIIDMQWVKAIGDMVKVVLWYDNEWGYSSRVADLAAHVVARGKGGI